MKTEIKTVRKIVLKTGHKIIYSYFKKKMSFIKVKDPRKREELIKDFIETRKRIKDNFIAKKVGEIEYQTGLTKLFKPVTETQKATAKEITEAQKAAAEKITQELLPIKEGIEGLPGAISVAGQSLSFPAYPALEMTEEKLTNIGPTASNYLLPTFRQKATQSDIKPGDPKGTFFKINETPIKIENDDIIIKDERFKGTPGLWKLLTSKHIPDITEYNAVDLRDYITIMHITKATYDKKDKRVGGNDKMNKLIKPLVKALEEDKSGNKLITEINKHFGFEEETDEEETDEEEEEEYEVPASIPLTPTSKAGQSLKGTGLRKAGQGLKILPSDPNALIDRFDLLFSSKKAGHTGVRNEIVSILDELKRQGVLKTNEYKKLNSLIKK